MKLSCAILFLAITCVNFAYAEGDNSKDSTQNIAIDTSLRFSQNNVLTVFGVVLSHYALRNSESLHDWPFFAFAAPAINSLNKMELDLNKFFTIKGSFLASLTPMNLGFTLCTDLSILHLLDIAIQGSTSSAFNYENSFYTGANDGEPWKTGGDIRVNGFYSEMGVSLIYILPFEHFNMAMISATVEGVMDENDFDEIYKNYDPDFKTFVITPTLMFKINKNCSGMFMTPIAKNRKFNKYKFDAGEELMLTRTGTQWKMNALMAMLNIKI